MADPRPTTQVNPNNNPQPVSPVQSTPQPVSPVQQQGFIPPGSAQPQFDPGQLANPTASQKAGQTDQPEQFQELGAGAVRYGIPIAAGIAMPQMTFSMLAAQALIAGGSEVMARRIERASQDPELDSMYEDLQAGSITGLIDFGLAITTKGLGVAFRKVGHKVLIPSQIPDDVRIAQEVLGEITPETIKKKGPLREFLKWTGATEGKRPFSLTYGQINAEEKRFINYIESVTRSGMFSRGKMAAFDARNERAVEGLITDYVKSRASKTTGPEFATMVNRLIGEGQEVGEAFEPVQAYRKYLYYKFEDQLATSGKTIDGIALRDTFKKGAAVTQGAVDNVYRELRGLGLVPPLEASQRAQTTIRRTTTEKFVGGTSDVTRKGRTTDLQTDDVAEFAKRTEAERQGVAKTTDTTRREIESLTGPTEGEIALDWARLPASDVNEIIKVINSAWKAGAKNEQMVGGLKRLRSQIEPQFIKEINSTPGLKELHDAADTFFKKEAKSLRSKAVLAAKDALEGSPSTVMSLLGGGSGQTTARGVYDRLLKLKSALYLGEEGSKKFTQAVQTDPTGIKQALEGTPFPRQLQDAAKEWDKTFLRPLRYSLITRHIDDAGNLRPDQFLKTLKDNADTPEFFTEVFGGPKQLEEIKRLMTTLDVLQRSPGEKSIFIQLAQAGALGGAGSTFLSDNPDVKTGGLIGGTIILLGPAGLAKMLTNPQAIRSFTDGLNAGVHSSKFSMALRKFVGLEAAREIHDDSATQDTVDFFSSIQ